MRMANPSGFAALQKKAPLVGAFFMLACWVSQAQAFCPAPSRAQWVAVRHVVDGDTVRLVDGRSAYLPLPKGLKDPDAIHAEIKSLLRVD